MDGIERFSNTALAAQMRAAAARNALGHAIIFCGEGDLVSAALYTACAMQCTSDGAKPCLSCAQCRKVLGDIHPDVSTVRDDEHKEIAVDIVRGMRADAFIIPNEGRRKVYIFDDCDRLNPRAQNILLKLVEEGPAYASFLFCARNSSALLQTIRSRCVSFRVGAEAASAEQKDDGRAAALCRLLASGKRSEVAAFLFSLEAEKTFTRESLGALCAAAREIVCAALFSHHGAVRPMQDDETSALLMRALSVKKLSAIADVFAAQERNCTYNVGVGHALGSLAVELEGLI